MCITCEGLPVTLLKCGAELLSRTDLVGVRERLARCPLVDLMQSLLPLHRRHQLLHQLPPHLALIHIPFSIHVGVHVDFWTADLNRGQILVLHM